MCDEILYRPIATEKAIEIVRRGETLSCYEIPDLRKLLEKLAQDEPDLELRCDRCKIIDCNCEKMELPNELCFSNSIFINRVGFRATKFKKHIFFQSIIFEDNVRVCYATFEGQVSFSNSIFKKNADYTKTIFNKEVFFREAEFKEDVIFVRSEFNEALFFDKAHFSSTARFNDSIFHKNVLFPKCIFHQKVEFNCSTFASVAWFKGAKFIRYLSFQGSNVEGKLNLENSKFFSNACLNLSGINIGSGGRILLQSAQIGRYKWCSLKYVPNAFLIDGEQSSDYDDLKRAADQYNTLRDNFRLLPSKELEEDICHYKYKDLIRRAKTARKINAPSEFKKCISIALNRFCTFLDWLVMKWCLGYGIYTKRILMTAIVLIVFFSGIYGFFAGQQTIKGFNDNFNALYFSVITFTTIGYGDYAPLGWLRLFAGVEGLLGLVLMAIFTVSFARKLIR